MNARKEEGVFQVNSIYTKSILEGKSSHLLTVSGQSSNFESKSLSTSLSNPNYDSHTCSHSQIRRSSKSCGDLVEIGVADNKSVYNKIRLHNVCSLDDYPPYDIVVKGKSAEAYPDLTPKRVRHVRIASKDSREETNSIDDSQLGIHHLYTSTAKNRFRQATREVIKANRLSKMLNHLTEIASSKVQYLYTKSKSILKKNYEDYYTCRLNPCMPDKGNFPYFSIIVIVLCLSSYAYHATINVNETMAEHLENLETSEFIYYERRCRNFKDPWRYITYSFLHIDQNHLLCNLVILLLSFPAMETIHGSIRTGTLYLLGVLLGSIASGIIHPNAYLLGASGGCYAMVLFNLSDFCMNFREMKNKKMLYIRLGLIVPMCCVALWDVYEVFSYMGVYYEFHLVHDRENVHDHYGNASTSTAGQYTEHRADVADEHRSNTKISNTAHAAGALTGLLLGVPMVRNLELDNYERMIRRLCLALYCFISAASITITIVNW